MRTIFWHRFMLMVGPGIWAVISRSRGMLSWISRISPEIRLENRCGKMKGDEVLRQRLAAVLRPLDILVQRGPLKLSDGMIPSYFKHVAIFLGVELAKIASETIPASSNPSATACTENVVLEATRAGVRLVSLEEVLNVDSVGVLRLASISPEEKQGIVAQAARELGKEYDFHFEVDNYRKQFCCKLVSCLFPRLPFADYLGAGTAIVPDDIVWPVINAQPGAPLLEFLIHHGLPVAADQQSRVLAQLLRDGCRREPRGQRYEFQL